MKDNRYSIAHPTDLSETSRGAFLHALGFALAKRAELSLLHIEHGGRSTSMDHFPAVRETLIRWGRIDANAQRDAVDRELGVLVNKVSIRDHDEASGVDHFVKRNGIDLVVVGTAGREGVGRLIHHSVSENIAAHTDAPTLFVQEGTRGFVDTATGEIGISRILVPVAAVPDPTPALHELHVLIDGLGLGAANIEFVHVGDNPPEVLFGVPHEPQAVRTESGDPIDTILALAEDSDLIVMPTERRNSLLDKIRGTTTERVLRLAPCPVLAIPA